MDESIKNSPGYTESVSYHTANMGKQFLGETNKTKQNKSRIRETLTISVFADSSTDTVKSCLFHSFLHFLALFSNLFCIFLTFCDISVSQVTCHMSYVTFHLSLMPTATDLPLLIPQSSTVDWFQIQSLY